MWQDLAYQGDKPLDIHRLCYSLDMIVKEYQDCTNWHGKATLIVSNTISWAGILKRTKGESKLNMCCPLPNCGYNTSSFLKLSPTTLTKGLPIMMSLELSKMTLPSIALIRPLSQTDSSYKVSLPYDMIQAHQEWFPYNQGWARPWSEEELRLPCTLGCKDFATASGGLVLETKEKQRCPFGQPW